MELAWHPVTYEAWNRQRRLAVWWNSGLGHWCWSVQLLNNDGTLSGYSDTSESAKAEAKAALLGADGLRSFPDVAKPVKYPPTRRSHSEPATPQASDKQLGLEL